MTVCWPAVQQPGSEAERCWGCAAAGGLRFAASDAAAELHTSAAGTVLLCWAVCVTPAGIPAHSNRHKQSGLSLHKLNLVRVQIHRNSEIQLHWWTTTGDRSKSCMKHQYSFPPSLFIIKTHLLHSHTKKDVRVACWHCLTLHIAMLSSKRPTVRRYAGGPFKPHFSYEKAKCELTLKLRRGAVNTK